MRPIRPLPHGLRRRSKTAGPTDGMAEGWLHFSVRRVPRRVTAPLELGLGVQWRRYRIVVRCWVALGRSAASDHMTEGWHRCPNHSVPSMRC